MDEILETLVKLNPWWDHKKFETGILRNKYVSKIKLFCSYPGHWFTHISKCAYQKCFNTYLSSFLTWNKHKNFLPSCTKKMTGMYRGVLI